jgi:hypothetical protein
MVKGIISDLKEMKKRGNGIMIVMVENGTVASVMTKFTDDPNDVILTYKALVAVNELGLMELMFKRLNREKKIGGP